MPAPPSPPRVILLTGPPGVGKTTCIHRVLERLQAYAGLPGLVGVQGFYTQEVRSKEGQRLGFDVVAIPSGRRGVLARVKPAGDGPLMPGGGGARGQPFVGRYAVDVAGFESVALPTLAPTATPAAAPQPGQPPRIGARLFVIDEVGKMELLSCRFMPAVRAALDDTTAVVIGTVPAEDHSRGLREVAEVRGRPDVVLLTLTQANRNDMAADAFGRVMAALEHAGCRAS